MQLKLSQTEEVCESCVLAVVWLASEDRPAPSASIKALDRTDRSEPCPDSCAWAMGEKLMSSNELMEPAWHKLVILVISWVQLPVPPPVFYGIFNAF